MFLIEFVCKCNCIDLGVGGSVVILVVFIYCDEVKFVIKIFGGIVFVYFKE